MAKRPDPTTMEGMLWNSYHVLESALNPDTVGIPKTLFLDSRGIVLISVAEAGFIFSGNVGTGIVMACDKDGKWSAPCAVGLGGVGLGWIFGVVMKHVIIFLMDEHTAKAYSGRVQLQLAARVGLTVGPFGRNAGVSLSASEKGLGGAVGVAFSQGAFAAAGIHGGTLSPRPQANKAFYGKDLTPTEILFENAVDIPQNSIIPEIHEMLDQLSRGSTWLASEEKKEKMESVRHLAVKAGEEAREKYDDIEYVDPEIEAEKEKAKESEGETEKETATESEGEAEKEKSKESEGDS